jgi:putative PIN family toxin of toxin-antitoxin system
MRYHPKETMRLVIDTDVLVAGMRSDQGASRQILLLALDRQIVTLASVPLFLEYEAVATRADHLTQSGLTVEETNAVIDALAAVMEPVNLRFLWRPRLRDPNDEMVLGTAVNGNADYIVTFNVRHLEKEAAAFAIKASQPREILQVIRRGKRGEIHEKE